jgi:hypothetical protein
MLQEEDIVGESEQSDRYCVPILALYEERICLKKLFNRWAPSVEQLKALPM